MVSNLIDEQLNRLPHSPGVYLMRDADGTILYIGKAVNLCNRVRSYFNATRNLTPKLQRMVSRIADIDYFIATSEQEALILEANLIKQHHPRYNVRLKDDKTFPYLKIDLNNVGDSGYNKNIKVKFYKNKYSYKLRPIYDIWLGWATFAVTD